MVGLIEFGAEAIPYEVCFVPTRRTLGIEVHPDMRVVVKAPLGCDRELIAQRLRKRAAWISRQIADFRRYTPRTPQRQYVRGETHLYLGRQYRLKVAVGDEATVGISRGQIVVTLPGAPDAERIKALLQRWYLARARLVLAEVLDSCLLNFKEKAAPRMIIRAMQSRWGSLSPAGTMTLNVNLIRAPRACIEYVVTHELCHVEYRDHDAHFYRLLERVLPDWKRRKQRLEAALL